MLISDVWDINLSMMHKLFVRMLHNYTRELFQKLATHSFYLLAGDDDQRIKACWPGRGTRGWCGSPNYILTAALVAVLLLAFVLLLMLMLLFELLFVAFWLLLAFAVVLHASPRNSSMYWKGTWKFCPLCSTIKWPRHDEAPTTFTLSPFFNCSVGGLVMVSSGKFIFIIRVWGKHNFVLPLIV